MSAWLRSNARLIVTLAVWGGCELLWRANPSPDGSGIVRADFGITGVALIVSSVFNFLGGLFRGRVDPGVKRALEGIRGAIAEIGRSILDGLAWAGGKMTAILAAVKRFIARAFGPLFEMLKRFVTKVARILDRILGPIINFLDMVRQHLWGIYRDFIRPVLDVIEFIRFPLRILSAFNIEWAKRLDATLANLEDWITDNFTFVMGKVNQALDALNQIRDVAGLLKRYALMNSLLRDIHIQSAMWWRWRFKLEDPAAIAERNRRLGERTMADVKRDTETVIVTGDGPYGALVREMSIQWRMYLDNAGR